jgi:hypothetical protein
MKVSVLLTLLMTCVPIYPLNAATSSPGADRAALASVPRVRAADARIRVALRDGIKRSASFRRVLQRVEELDVIVYVETQPLLRSRLAGTTTWVTATKDFRYVRVSLNPGLSARQTVAALAHELEHVAEIGAAPSIIDTHTLRNYYRQVGLAKRVPSDEWETEAAKITGETVRQELAMSSSLVSDSTNEIETPAARE